MDILVKLAFWKAIFPYKECRPKRSFISCKPTAYNDNNIESNFLQPWMHTYLAYVIIRDAQSSIKLWLEVSIEKKQKGIEKKQRKRLTIHKTMGWTRGTKTNHTSALPSRNCFHSFGFLSARLTVVTYVHIPNASVKQANIGCKQTFIVFFFLNKNLPLFSRQFINKVKSFEIFCSHLLRFFVHNNKH